MKSFPAVSGILPRLLLSLRCIRTNSLPPKLQLSHCAMLSGSKLLYDTPDKASEAQLRCNQSSVTAWRKPEIFMFVFLA